MPSVLGGRCDVIRNAGGVITEDVSVPSVSGGALRRGRRFGVRIVWRGCYALGVGRGVATWAASGGLPCRGVAMPSVSGGALRRLGSIPRFRGLLGPLLCPRCRAGRCDPCGESGSLSRADGARCAILAQWGVCGKRSRVWLGRLWLLSWAFGRAPTEPRCSGLWRSCTGRGREVIGRSGRPAPLVDDPGRWTASVVGNPEVSLRFVAGRLVHCVRTGRASYGCGRGILPTSILGVRSVES
jgi:hypothetical protein